MRHRSRLLAFLAALALVLVACDGDGDDDATDVDQASSDDSDVADDPEGALADAVAAFAEWDGVEMDLSFQVDDTARDSILADAPEDAEFLDVLLNSSIRIVTVGDEDAGAVEFAVNVDGDDIIEFYLAATGETLDDVALRVDLSGIAELSDDPTLEGEIDALVGQAAMFGLGDAAQALADGEWIALAGLDELNQMMGDMAPQQDEADEEQVEDAMEDLAERTETFARDDLSVTHVGSEDAGERLRAVADGPALQGYLSDVTEILSAYDLLDGVSPAEIEQDLQELSDEDDVTLDVWISGGEVSQVAIDLGSLDDAEIDGEFLVVVGISNFTGSLSAPSGAVEIDLMETFGMFLGDFAMDDLDFGDDAFGDDAFEEDAIEDDAFEDDAFEDDAMDGAMDEELSDEDIAMMLEFMECISEEELEGFAFIMPEVAEAAEEAIEAGELELC